MQLTRQQLDFFTTFGYLHFPSLFSQGEITSISEEFEYSIQHFGRGDQHDGSTAPCLAAQSSTAPTSAPS